MSKRALITFFGFIFPFLLLTKAFADERILVSTFKIRVDQYEKLTVTQSSGFQVANLYSRKFDFIIMARPHVPQSISSVKNRAKELKVSESAIKVKSFAHASIFYFDEANVRHIYSTRGGHLAVAKKDNQFIDIARFSLVNGSKK